MNFIEESEMSDRVEDHYLNNPKDLLVNNPDLLKLNDEEYDSSNEPF